MTGKTISVKSSNSDLETTLEIIAYHANHFNKCFARVEKVGDKFSVIVSEYASEITSTAEIASDYVASQQPVK